MSSDAPLVAHCASDHCITCADEGVAMKVARLDGGPGLAECVAEDGGKETVETTLVDPVVPGDRVLVHAGVALIRLDAEEASA